MAMQDGHAAFRTELGLAGITGVEKQNPIDGFVERLMRVTEYDYRRPFVRDAIPDLIGGRWRKNDVMDEKFPPGEFDYFRLLE